MKNNTKIPIAFLTISILLLLYTYYQSEFIYGGIRKFYYFIYYLSSFILIILSIITFFLSKKANFKILIILISTIFSLYVVQGFLLIYVDKKNIEKIRQSIAKKTNVKFDNRSKFEVYKDLKKEDDNVVVSMFSTTIINKNKPK